MYVGYIDTCMHVHVRLCAYVCMHGCEHLYTYMYISVPCKGTEVAQLVSPPHTLPPTTPHLPHTLLPTPPHLPHTLPPTPPSLYHQPSECGVVCTHAGLLPTDEITIDQHVTSRRSTVSRQQSCGCRRGRGLGDGHDKGIGTIPTGPENHEVFVNYHIVLH